MRPAIGATGASGRFVEPGGRSWWVVRTAPASAATCPLAGRRRGRAYRGRPLRGATTCRPDLVRMRC